jgi:hypothetical protein
MKCAPEKLREILGNDIKDDYELAASQCKEPIETAMLEKFIGVPA